MMAVAQRETFISRYRPLLELGRGGMARVYLAESVGSGLLRKLVVLKVLNQELASDPEMRSAFVREAEISARLNHPNIVNVHEVFEQGNTPVMVMQHLDGMALSDIVSRLQGKIPLKLHLNILCQVLDALHYFHELKGANGEPLECVHRDISPHNVMVLHEGGIKVVDFGVAKVREQSENHTRTGIIKGKIAYMPPEQLVGAGVDRRADIYSVGVMLWEAAAGRRLWRGFDASARMRAIVKGELPSIREAAPGISDHLAKIIERALSHAPEARFATAEEMQIELEQVTLTEGGHSLPRELAEFMRTNFGEDRRVKQRAIEKAVEDPEFTLADATWSNPPARTRSGVQVAGHAAGHSDSDPSVIITTGEQSRRPLIIGGIAAALCLAVGATFLLRGNEPVAAPATAASAAAATVTVRISSEPAGAEVFLDGIKLGVTPLVQTRPAASQSATVELRAPGRQTTSQVVDLKEDVTLSIALASAAVSASESAPKEAVQPTPSAVDSDDQDRRQAVRQRRPVARRADPSSDKPGPEAAQAAPVSAPAAAKGNSAAADCDPPYRLDPGGVKVFKPQCF